jgi:hypothetical protein
MKVGQLGRTRIRTWNQGIMSLPLSGRKSNSLQGVAETASEPLAYSLACNLQKAPDSCSLEGVKIDTDLAKLVNAWPALSATVKHMILAAVEA